MPDIVEEIPIGHRSTIRFLEQGRKLLASLPLSLHLQVLTGLRTVVSLSPVILLSSAGPPVQYPWYGFFPNTTLSHGWLWWILTVLQRKRSGVWNYRPVKFEPEQERIREKLREHKIDLLIGGMLEQPVAKVLSIDHLDIMHGSQQTIGFAGAHNLARLLNEKSRN